MTALTIPKTSERVKINYLPLELFDQVETEYYSKKDQENIARHEVLGAIHKYVYRYG